MSSLKRPARTPDTSTRSSPNLLRILVVCRDRDMVSLLGVAATLVACATAAPGDQVQSPSTSYNNVSATAWHAMPLCKGHKIEDATIDELQGFMANGSLTSVQLVTCYMHRYYQTNQYIK